MTDPSPEEIEQLARSLAMSTAMTEADRLRVIDLLRELAEARRRHPSGAVGERNTAR
jgi:hypothetical protein